MNIEQKIRKAMENVYDPEIHKSLIELDMVGDITVEGDTALINIRLTTPKCPMKSAIGNDVEKEVKKIEDIRNVKVVFGEMDKRQKEALIARLHGRDARENPLENVKMIAIGSGKGGVGKSSITAGIAAALSRKGYRTGLIDADILGYSIPQIMGIKHIKPVVIEGRLLMPVEKYGVRVMSMGNLVEKDEAFIWRGPMLAKALEQFIYDVYWGELDVMLIDMPPGTGDVPLNVMQSNPGTNIVIVTTPQSFATGVAKRLGLMAEKAGCRVGGVIENMSYFICDNCSKKHFLFGRGETKELCEELNTRLLGDIPFVAMGDLPDSYEEILFKGGAKLGPALDNIAQNLIQGVC